jgi:23S rRNA (cytosine1962-C5)-methyltransferase
MFATDQYQLLDFGAGRKLERFGAYVLDRPAPAAAGIARRDPEAWPRADARFVRSEGTHGRWQFNRPLPPAWTVRCAHLTFGLKFAQSGQVGLFPEQAACWDWIARQVCLAERSTKVLNLFAYTGGSTLAAAAVGAEVAHVDAAATVVGWARANARASALADAPIRWLIDDALKFARRELKRGQLYDAVILDPPSYGHGPGGETWQLEDQLPELIEVCLRLTSPDRQFLLLTSHSGELASATALLKAVVVAAPALRAGGRSEASDLLLNSAAGGRLHCGAAVQWTSRQSSSAAPLPREQDRLAPPSNR